MLTLYRIYLYYLLILVFFNIEYNIWQFHQRHHEYFQRLIVQENQCLAISSTNILFPNFLYRQSSSLNNSNCKLIRFLINHIFFFHIAPLCLRFIYIVFVHCLIVHCLNAYCVNIMSRTNENHTIRNCRSGHTRFAHIIFG